jgi:RimJ/RimL family protein N-acetyltransferase
MIMNEEITIRQALQSDCVKLSEIIEAVIRAIPYYNDLAKESEIKKFQPSDLKLKILDDKHSVIVATIKDEIVGFCLSRFDDNLIWLEWFGVLEIYRGKGISNLLLTELDKTVLIRECHKIWCDCRTSNKASMHILTSHGYRQIVTIPNHWYKQDFILWEKPFNS